MTSRSGTYVFLSYVIILVGSVNLASNFLVYLYLVTVSRHLAELCPPTNGEGGDILVSVPILLVLALMSTSG